MMAMGDGVVMNKNDYGCRSIFKEKLLSNKSAACCRFRKIGIETEMNGWMHR